MRTIRVEQTLSVPAERVFDVLADHAGYTRFPGVRSAKLTRTGTPAPGGLGAIRELAVGPGWFEEEITAFERPRRIEYRILRSRPPLEHQLGRIDLTPVPEGVHVVWTSTFRVKLPLVGGLATAIAAGQMSKTFSAALKAAEQLAR